MSLLIVQLPARARLGPGARGDAPVEHAELAYVLSADGRSVDGEGRCAPALLPKATTTVVVPAVTDVSFHRLTVPRAPAARLRAALRGLLEERLLDDPETLHIALGPGVQAGAEGWVAVTDRAWLTARIDAIERSGRAVDRVTCALWPGGEPLELDVQAADPGIEETDPDRALVTLAGVDGVTVTPWPTRLRPGGVAANLLPEPLPADLRCAASPAFVKAAEAWLGRPVAVRTPGQRLLTAAHGPWNLRQFDLSPRHRGATLLRDGWSRFKGPAWRPVRWGLVGLVAVQLIGLNAWAWRQRSELRERRDTLVALLRSTHPQVRAVLDAPVQMRRENDQLRSAAGRAGDTDLEPMLQAAASAWPDGVAVQTLRYENAQLSLGAPEIGAQDIERLRGNLQPAGWRVESGPGLVTLRRAAPAGATPVAGVAR